MRIVRTLALTGAAAAAFFGTATTAAADTPEDAAAAVQAAAAEASGTPVTLPSGNTLRISGLDTAAYRADDGHHTAAVQLAAAGEGETPPGAPSFGEGNEPARPVPDQPNHPQPQTYQQQPTGYDPNVHSAAGGGALTATVVAALVLAIVVGYSIKRGGLNKTHAVACVALGVLLAPTFVGPLVNQLSGSGAQMVGNLWAGL